MPQDRAGRFSTELFERYQRSEKALVAALTEMYVIVRQQATKRSGNEQLRLPALLATQRLGDPSPPDTIIWK